MCEAASPHYFVSGLLEIRRKSPNVVCELSAVDTLITDRDIGPDYLAALRGMKASISFC